MTETETSVTSHFIDTNIWLYAFMPNGNSPKVTQAKKVIENSESIIISTQVISETCVNLIKKAQFTELKIQKLIEAFYAKYIVVELNYSTLISASKLREKYTFSFWDSVIVASALSADASILYSEDMHEGLIVNDRLRIANPLKP